MNAAKEVQQQAERPIARKTVPVKPTAPEPEESEIEFSEYTRSRSERTLKWVWFLSTSLPKIKTSDPHCEANLLELCLYNSDQIVDKGDVVWLEFVDEQGVECGKASEGGNLEVFVEFQHKGETVKRAYLVSPELFHKCIPNDFKQFYGRPLAYALGRRGNVFPADNQDMATWLHQQGAVK